MTYDPHSTHSTRTKSTHNPRRKWLIGGGVIVAFLVILLIASSMQQPAIDGLIRSAQQQAGSQQEKSLKTISVVSWRNDSAQKALAQYYISLGRFDLAGETLAKGSSKLSVEAAKNYTEAGEYQKAQAELSILLKNQLTADTRSEQSIVAFNLGDTSKGCDYADKSSNSELRNACQILKAGEPSRENSYKLIALHIYAPAEKALTNVSEKTAGDWLTLAAIASRQNKTHQATQQLTQAVAQFPFDREVAERALAYCKQEGSGMPACTQLSRDAEKVLKQTDFKS